MCRAIPGGTSFLFASDGQVLSTSWKQSLLGSKFRRHSWTSIPSQRGGGLASIFAAVIPFLIKRPLQILTSAGLFAVGPESCGANPGPTCYRNGGPLAITDANVLLGRIQSQHFPHIFGPEKNASLDIDATKAAFEALTDVINAHVKEHGTSYPPPSDLN